MRALGHFASQSGADSHEVDQYLATKRFRRFVCSSRCTRTVGRMHAVFDAIELGLIRRSLSGRRRRSGCRIPALMPLGQLRCGEAKGPNQGQVASLLYSTIPKQMCGAPCEMHIQAEVAKTGNTSSTRIIVVTGVCPSSECEWAGEQCPETRWSVHSLGSRLRSLPLVLAPERSLRLDV